METRGKKRQREEDSTSSTSTSTPRSFSAGETSAGVSAASRHEKSRGVTREKKPRIDKTREKSGTPKSGLDKSRKALKKSVSARKSQPGKYNRYDYFFECQGKTEEFFGTEGLFMDPSIL